MTVAFGATLVALGVLGAFVAGLVGVGGAIIMIPLLLYVPPLLGVGSLDVRTVAAVTMVQVFVAALSGMLAHRRYRAVDVDLARVGGLAMAAAAFVGGVGSRFAPPQLLLLVFALMATAAAALLFQPLPEAPEVPGAGRARYGRLRTVAVGGGVGLVAGLVGAGGAFLLVPLLLYVVRVPIRIAIGSSLAITTLGATAGFAGKLVSGQIPALPALLVALGAVPGAQVGAAVSRRATAPLLKRALALIVVAAAARVWWDLLAG